MGLECLRDWLTEDPQMAYVCDPQPQPPYPLPGFSLHCFRAVPGSITAYLHALLETPRRSTSPPEGKQDLPGLKQLACAQLSGHAGKLCGDISVSS